MSRNATQWCLAGPALVGRFPRGWTDPHRRGAAGAGCLRAGRDRPRAAPGRPQM